MRFGSQFACVFVNSLLVAAIAFAQPERGHEYRLFLLSGQSNMEGYGFTSDLPATRVGPVEEVRVFNGNTAGDDDPSGGLGVWGSLQPGLGVFFRSDGTRNLLSERFGVELSLGHRLVERLPETRIAFIKYVRGGSPLYLGGSGYGTWNPDVDGANQYDHLLRTLTLATASRDIDGDGREDTLLPAGIVWLHGEADASDSPEAAQAYEANLRKLMDLLRAALRVDDLPVLVVEISGERRPSGEVVNMPYFDQVTEAQRRFVAADSCAALLANTRAPVTFLADRWHYDSGSYLRKGEALADAMVDLIDACARGPGALKPRIAE